MRIKLAEVIAATGGAPSPGDYSQTVNNVVIDSREAGPGSLFVAFAGARADGHDFVADSARAGAVAALVQRDVEAPPGFVTVRVPDTLLALQRLAGWYRAKFAGLQVIGITGSSGKTTTKELVAGVLEQKHVVLKSLGNHNNEIGLPLTLFALEEHHRWAVLEMGMSAPGEIRQLCSISKPGLGIITNIGEAHMEYLGSRQAIADAKFELAEQLAPPAVMILNGDDPWQRRRAQAGLPGVKKIIFYGLRQGDVTAANIDRDIHGSRFDVRWQGKSIGVTLPLPGEHNISNALAAFAAGLVAEVPPQAIVQGLAAARGEARRLQAFDVNGFTVIDDSYNANPDSTLRALELLGSYPSGRRKVAFLGSMLELGAIAREKHRLIGAAAVENKVSLLVAVGEFAEDIRLGAIEAGLAPEAATAWPDSRAALAATENIRANDVVLVKGSQGVQMDVIVKFLKRGRQ